MLSKVVELVLKKCLGHKDNESLLIVTDMEYSSFSMAFHESACKLGISSVISCKESSKFPDQEPPDAVTAAMQNTDIALLITKSSMLNTSARLLASRKGKTRIAGISGIPKERLPLLLNVDYDNMKKYALKISGELAKASVVRVTSPSGTDLTFKIKEGGLFHNAGIIAKKGEFCTLPAGTLSLLPLEKSVHGTIVADASIEGIGLLKKPVTIKVEKGRAYEINSLQLKKIIAPHGANALCIASLGLGINPCASISGCPHEDIITLGTMFIALGDNTHIGGSNRVPCRINCVIKNPGIYVDNYKLPGIAALNEKNCDASEAVTEGIFESASEIAFSLGNELYKILFNSVNMPYYILDIDSQRFLEVNQKFADFTGYAREELLSGSMTAKDLVSEEDMALFESKLSKRKTITTEQYTLNLKNKKGEKTFAQLHVQYLKLKGRNTVIVVVYDLSDMVRMAKNLREKMLVLADSNARIHALTEKIKNVPYMTQLLLNAESEMEILEKASAMLCDRQGLAYKSASFYFAKENKLRLFYSSQPMPGSGSDTNANTAAEKEIPIDSPHPYARLFKNEMPSVENELQIALAMKGRQETVGIIEVSLHHKEKQLMDENEQAKRGYYDVLKTLTNMIGLIIENRRLYERVQKQAITDRLTKVFNRRYFENRFKDEVRRATRYSRDLSILFLDVDNLKTINDTYGHMQGDLVLSTIGTLLKKNSRDVDVVCRYGGDEFLILMPETNMESASLKAERIRETVERTDFPAANSASALKTVTMSIGVSALSENIKDHETLFKTVDASVYEAKNTGRNKVIVWKQ